MRAHLFLRLLPPERTLVVLYEEDVALVSESVRLPLRHPVLHEPRVPGLRHRLLLRQDVDGEDAVSQEAPNLHGDALGLQRRHVWASLSTLCRYFTTWRQMVCSRAFQYADGPTHSSKRPSVPFAIRHTMGPSAAYFLSSTSLLSRAR